jgi:hypothetical protein
MLQHLGVALFHIACISSMTGSPELGKAEDGVGTEYCTGAGRRRGQRCNLGLFYSRGRAIYNLSRVRGNVVLYGVRKKDKYIFWQGLIPRRVLRS